MKQSIEISLTDDELKCLERIQKAFGLSSLGEALRHCALQFAEGVSKIFLDCGVITPKQESAK